MGVYKKAHSKFWWYRFTLDGKRYQISTKVENKKQAEGIAKAAWTQKVNKKFGLATPGPSRSIGELLDRLEDDFKLRDIFTARNQSNFKAARAAFDSKMKAASLTSADVDHYILKRQRQGLRPATINRAVGLVAQAFKKAIEREELDRAPKFRHLSEKGNARKGFFEADEFARLLQHLPDDLRDFCRFAYITGWRRGEIASLTWSDVEDDVVRLRGENSKNDEARSVVLTPELAAIIDRRRQLRIVNAVLTEHVFHRGGAPVQEFRKAWSTACMKAALSGKLFHDFRRTAVRSMVRSGVAQSIAMKISGHKTASMFRRYDIANEDDLREAMLKVERYNKAQAKKVVSIQKRRA